jgi:hypothetical protein
MIEVGKTDYKLRLDSGTVYGTMYHTVQPIGWMMYGDNAGWNKMMSWCVKTFGPTPIDGIWTPNSRWYSNNARFWFRYEKDLILFILKWS